MADKTGAVTLKGNPKTLTGDGELVVGQPAPDAVVVAGDMSEKTLQDFKGKVVIVSVVPSLDTPVCDTETRRFNSEAAGLGDDVVILTISVDTPMAQKRWCGAADVDQVICLSDFKYHAFGKATSLRIKEIGLLARCVFVLDRDGVVQYIQFVKEVAEEPDYAEVIAAAKKLL